ncbi:uncharacterized protein EV154DRAFT_489048 [Mucor mucedo]|uniref:uncharacterized protein n=1 Tax=Mucor mucedo TaxID=29922 RepID=UPI00221F220A|nr:uncharacterized protein EV154DRAFT_489048 [Mucor mucedo]KAI7863557.1 hypothetical protein EV154DRAFT_489048 [Mucor mucedo]
MWENRLSLRNTLVGKITLKSHRVKSVKNDTGRGRTPKPRFQRPTLYPLSYNSGGVSTCLLIFDQNERGQLARVTLALYKDFFHYARVRSSTSLLNVWKQNIKNPFQAEKNWKKGQIRQKQKNNFQKSKIFFKDPLDHYLIFANEIINEYENACVKIQKHE